MRNAFVLLALLFATWGLSVSAQENSDEERSTTQMSAVERRMVEIELEVQLRAYRKILMALHEAEIDWAFMELDDSASADKRDAMQTRLKLLKNLKETAVLKALKLEENVTAAQNQTSLADVRIRDLLTQKRDVLKERLDGTQQLYDVGDTQPDRVLNARTDLLRAELDLVTSKAERIAVLESQLKTQKEFEQWATRRFEDGTDSFDAKFIATADRLEAEIALLREESKP